MDKNTVLQELDKVKSEGNHERAITLCEKHILNDPQFVELYEEIGDNYISLREYKKAEKALNYAIKLDKNSANGNYLLGFLYSARAQWKLSIKHLEKANKAQPNHPEILRCLGWSIFHFSKPMQGLAVLERAMNMTPNDPLILSDIGVCYLNLRRFNEAIRVFNKVMAIEPENEKVKECLRAAKFFKKEYDKIEKDIA